MRSIQVLFYLTSLVVLDHYEAVACLGHASQAGDLGGHRRRCHSNVPVVIVGQCPDPTADGTGEIALLMVAPDGATKVGIYDLVVNTLIDSMDMLAVGTGHGLMTTPDIDSSSTEELVVLGEHFGADLIEIRDCADGDPLRYYFVP